MCDADGTRPLRDPRRRGGTIRGSRRRTGRDRDTGRRGGPGGNGGPGRLEALRQLGEVVGQLGESHVGVKLLDDAVVEALGKVSFTGASGAVSFNEFGDNKARVLTVYKVEGGAWKAAKTEDFK